MCNTTDLVHEKSSRSQVVRFKKARRESSPRMFIDKAMTQAAKQTFRLQSLAKVSSGSVFLACDHAGGMGNNQSKISAQDRSGPAMETEAFN
jgi:hypothetical protein